MSKIAGTPSESNENANELKDRIDENQMAEKYMWNEVFTCTSLSENWIECGRKREIERERE